MVDNTPYWAVDPHTWDMSYLDLRSTCAEVTFNIHKEEVVQHLIQAIQERGGKIFVSFMYYDREYQRYTEDEILQLAQFGSNIIHASIWLGEHVTTLAVSEAVFMTQSPLNFGRWELVQLPFTNIPLAFRIAVDIAIKCTKKHIHYSDHRWTVIKHVLSRLLIPGYKGGRGHDYDPDKPETWQDGLHCSQLALLFLKRCAIRGALYTPPKHTQKLLNTASSTCLPADLRKLVFEIWGGVGEFRDYRDVGTNVRKAWYKHYDGMRDTAPLNSI